jgi:hypothetical protein
MTDRRMTPANGRVAHLSLRGQIEADNFVEGEWMRVTVPLADLLAQPGGARDRQLLLGERLLVLERRSGHAFVQAQKDGYCGYLMDHALGPDQLPSHWVAAPATHLYAAPGLKSREVASLSFGAMLTVSAEHSAFFETAEGLFAPRQHLRLMEDFLTDPAHVAEMFLGTPYLWGGNSRAGIDCSGLVQAALRACGIACPGDSDQQFAALGNSLPDDAIYQRGDLLFWKGHVAIVVDREKLIHANGFYMTTNYECISTTLARISAQEGHGAFLGAKRL